MVSTMRMWQPPSIRPSVCCLYAATTPSQSQLRAPGSSTEGEMESVRLVGPMAPATRRGLWGSSAVTSLAASTASSDATLLSS